MVRKYLDTNDNNIKKEFIKYFSNKELSLT